MELQDTVLRDSASEQSKKPPRTSRESTLPNKPHFIKVMALSCDSDHGGASIRHSNDVCSSQPESGASFHPTCQEDSKVITLTLAEFVQNYSNFLPAEIMVVEGANTSPVALNDKDVLKVHRIKEQSMVLARANESQQYLIPFNAAIEFCVLYDPENNISKALKGYSFEKGSDLMSAEIRPKLVCARSSWEDKDINKVVVSNREVFVVGEIIPPMKKKGRKLIKLYSITKQIEKVIPDDCIANFSTKPSLLPLYLAEITGYLKSPFPCKAVLHDEGLVVPPHLCPIISNLSGLVLTLASINTEMVLVTTYMKEGMENPIPMDIPVELPQVKVKVLHAKDQDSEIDCTDEESAPAMCREEDKDSNALVDQNMTQDVSFVKEDEPYEVMAVAKHSACIKNVLEFQPQRLNKMPIKQTIAASGPLTPEQFAEQYGHALPAQVKIVESYQTTTGTCLLADEIYKVHFISATDGISMTDDKGILVLVSTDSCSQFGVIYNPHSNLTKAMNGYIFESVDDVVRASQLPRVLCATQSHRLSSPTSSVEEGEVLIVNDAEIALQTNAAVLTVYSVREGVTKMLQSECRGWFTTEPRHIQLHVGTILQYLSALLPMCAMMYPGSGGDVISGPVIVTLLQYHPKSTLVATTILSSKRDWNPYQPVEIPRDAPVKMVVLPCAPSPNAMGKAAPNYEMHSLSTEHAEATLAPVEGRDAAPPVAPRRYKASKKHQRDLAVAAARYRKTDHSVTIATDRLSRCPQIDVGQQKEGETPIATSNVVRDLGPREGESSSVREEVDATKKWIDPDRFEMLRCDVTELVKQLAALARQVSNIEGTLGDELVRMRDKTRERGSENKIFLETLTPSQVLHLLDVAGLGMYSEAFNREKIDGQLMCVLTDTVLRRDLNVSSELHRLKLLNIISGAVDVKTWFDANTI